MALPVALWHARAERARETAAQTKDAAKRAVLLLYAAECERIGDQCLLGFRPSEDVIPNPLRERAA